MFKDISLGGKKMKEYVIERIKTEMAHELTPEQLKVLTITLNKVLRNARIVEEKNKKIKKINYLSLFFNAKKMEGCSNRTLNYYMEEIAKFEKHYNKPLNLINTEDIRNYLTLCQNKKIANTTIDNKRRILSSFYRWLAAEDYIIKSPVERIKKIKTPVVLHKPFSEEDLQELNKEFGKTLRENAIFNLILSTGIRVGELEKINKTDVNFETRTIIVNGKGNKQREVYFDIRTKMILKEYVQKRQDDSPALFVSYRKNSTTQTYSRLTINSYEKIIRELGKKAGIKNCHPHRFRRTLATKAINKGMPVEQVQILLGHAKIDTTLHYAMVYQKNVKLSHEKYLC
jgi:site-specific recombinase XerD